MTTPVAIPASCDDIDLLACMRGASVVAFDLDGTLAVSKQPMEPRMARLFSTLTTLCDVAVISGGRYELFATQILSTLDGDADRSRLHLMPTCGSRYYRWHDGQWHEEYAFDLTDEQREAAFASLERRAREQGVWYERTWGDRLEDRGSQITYSALGQLAPPEIKEQWDPDGSRKRALAQAVGADLPDLVVRPGGTTSVDVCAQGIDKSYAVRRLCGQLGIEPRQMVFFGDRIRPGGNDYPAILAGAWPVPVRDPGDTARLVSRIIDILRAERDHDDQGIRDGHGGRDAGARGVGAQNGA